MSDDKKIQFAAPPVTERVIGALATLDTDELLKRMESWKNIIKNSFPREEIATNWHMTIQEKDGIPLLDKARPVIQMIYRHWNNLDETKPSICLQTRPDGFFVNARREQNNMHSFEEVHTIFKEWLPRWADCFGVYKYDASILHYVNELSEDITPQFISKKGTLEIGKALNVFSRFGGGFSNLVLPYDCRVTMNMSDEPPTTMSLHVKGLEKPAGANPLIKVEIIVKTKRQTQRNDLKVMVDDCISSHEILINGFKGFFTEHALETFKAL